MKRVFLVAFIALAVSIFGPSKPTRAQFQQTQGTKESFYVTVKGAKQGQFKGEVVPLNPTTKDHIPGIKFSMQVTAPTNVATAQATGIRQYSPISFTKLWGPSSGQFLAALSTGEDLVTVTFDFVSTGMDGKPVITQSIALTHAKVSSMRRYIGVPIGNEPPDPRELEDVSFTFQKIDFRDAAGMTFSE